MRRLDSPAAAGSGPALAVEPSWLKAVFLPPIGLILLAVMGLAAPRRWRALIVATAIGSLLLCSVPIVPRAVALLIAESVPYRPQTPPTEQAIVVLGGSFVIRPEYGGPDVGSDSLHRLRFAARLHAMTGLPVAITGGTPVPQRNATLADLMAEVMSEEYRVPVAWRERRSMNTLQNALRTAELLRPAGITRVVIVTDAIHMPRAMWSFRRAGLEPTAAPIDIPEPLTFEASDVLPRIDALVTSYNVAYEIVGLAWYRLGYALLGR